MPNITQVNLTAGVPTGPAGAATVSTIDNMVNLFPTLAAVTATGNAMDINVKSGGNPNGSALSSASAPVVIASDQGAVSTKGSLAIASTTSGQTGNLTMGAVTTAAPSYTTAQTDPLSLTTAGALRMDLSSVAGTATPVGSGVMATAPRVALATDSPGIISLGQATFASSIPVSIGPPITGSYSMGASSGTMAAGLAGAAPVFSFRYGGAFLAVVRAIEIEADNVTTAFVAGAGKFDLFAARSFSASDTGGTAGTLTGNNGKLRTSFSTTGVSDFRISSTATLTAGTRTLDAQPLGSIEFNVPTSIDADLLPTVAIFKAAVGEQPLVLAQNEGFVIQATVPGTGTWVFSVRVRWDEVSSF